MTRTAWIDAGNGASGDMLLGALVELGAVDVAGIVAALGVDASVDVTPVQRSGLTATHVEVTPGPVQPPRRWSDIRTLLEQADLPEPARTAGLATFARLAHAESTVHGISPEEVHFHEVGAVDSLVDVVGACVGLLALGADAVHSTPVALGGGTVRAAHGVLPVPGPAVLRLIQDGSVPAHGGPVDVELCTPTGAALLAEHVTSWGPMPAMTVDAVGTGAGTRNLSDRPNVLRIVVGSPLPTAATAGPAPGAVAESSGVFAASQLLLETNVDDLDPRLWPAILASLLDAGSADAWLTPILMKKGRPAHTLSVLVAAELADEARRIVFTETTSLGLRETVVGKHALERAFRSVEVDGIPVHVKVGLLDGRVVNVQPEYEDVAAAAATLGRPVKDVLAAALGAAERIDG